MYVTLVISSQIGLSPQRVELVEVDAEFSNWYLIRYRDGMTSYIQGDQILAVEIGTDKEQQPCK